MFRILQWQLSNLKSEITESDNSYAEVLRDRKYFRAIRWILLLMLFLMAILSLTIFTQDIEYTGNKFQALLVVMSTLALVCLGINSTYYIRMGYSFLFSFLLSILIFYKFTLLSFQKNTFISILLHLPHFCCLLLGWAFSFLSCYNNTPAAE